MSILLSHESVRLITTTTQWIMKWLLMSILLSFFPRGRPRKWEKRTTSKSGHSYPRQNCSQWPPAQKTGKGSLSCSSSPPPPDDPICQGTELNWTDYDWWQYCSLLLSVCHTFGNKFSTKQEHVHRHMFQTVVWTCGSAKTLVYVTLRFFMFFVCYCSA